MMSAWFARVKSTFLENWDPGLQDLSIPHSGFALTHGQAHSLGLANPAYSHWFRPGKAEGIELIAREIDDRLRQFPSGGFVRLGSRSPKDSFYAATRGMKVRSGDEALRLLTGNSQRVAWDLRVAIANAYHPHIFVREWCEIPPWAELRCFMRQRELVGISQYHWRGPTTFTRLTSNIELIKAQVQAFFLRFRNATRLTDVIFDIMIDPDPKVAATPSAVKLIELNPYLPQTDACLFTWATGGDFDGTLRVVQERPPGILRL